MQRLIDGRQWFSLSDMSTPLGYSIELVPEGDRALRPIELLSLLTAQPRKDFSSQTVIEAQASAWASTILDGDFDNRVLQEGPELIYHLAKVRNDALNGYIDVICCIREASNRIAVATYEHVGILGTNGSRAWFQILTSLANELSTWPFEKEITFGSRPSVFRS